MACHLIACASALAQVFGLPEAILGQRGSENDHGRTPCERGLLPGSTYAMCGPAIKHTKLCCKISLYSPMFNLRTGTNHSDDPACLL